MHVESRVYGPAVASLVENARCNELARGAPDPRQRNFLAALSPEAVVAPHLLAQRDMALACIAGLWLRYDFLDESHRISQSIENSSGSFWHGVMHRREGDFDNAKYWFRRVGSHEVFGPLAIAAAALAREAGVERAAGCLVKQADWDPYRFIDLCQQAQENSLTLADLCRKIQQREWELLFDHCHRRAIGQ